jgi:hypothetical protein
MNGALLTMVQSEESQFAGETSTEMSTLPPLLATLTVVGETENAQASLLPPTPAAFAPTTAPAATPPTMPAIVRPLRPPPAAPAPTAAATPVTATPAAAAAAAVAKFVCVMVVVSVCP